MLKQAIVLSLEDEEDLPRDGDEKEEKAKGQAIDFFLEENYFG